MFTIPGARLGRHTQRSCCPCPTTPPSQGSPSTYSRGRTSGIHCNENPIYVFLFWELRGLSPNLHFHAFVMKINALFLKKRKSASIWRWFESRIYYKLEKSNSRSNYYKIVWYCTVIRIISISAKFDICAVVGLNRRLIEAKIHTFKCPKCLFSYNKCPI
jgi:hypothetical protein